MDEIKMTVEPVHPPPIAVVIATREEAQPFIDILHLAPIGKMPCMLYGKDRTILAISGVGKTNAAIATTFLCSTFHPSVVLNLGAAGSTGVRCGLGGIFHVTAVCEPDRPHFPSGKPHQHSPRTLPGFDEARLATHDRPIIEREDREKASVHAEMVDMEGAAVAQAAHRFSIPCVLFKFISDTPQQTDTATTIEYMRNYSSLFCRFIIERVLPCLAGEDPG
jgi:adenosylhomocysteine nucleosidase